MFSERSSRARLHLKVKIGGSDKGIIEIRRIRNRERNDTSSSEVESSPSSLAEPEACFPVIGVVIFLKT